MKYSPSTKGFYHVDIHTTIPDDAIEIKDEDYLQLFKNQNLGIPIGQDANGYPISLPKPVPDITHLRTFMVISAVDFRLNLAKKNLLQTVLTAMNSLTDLDSIKIKWEYAPAIQRLDPDLESFCINTLKLTDVEIDELFTPIITSNIQNTPTPTSTPFPPESGSLINPPSTPPPIHTAEMVLGPASTPPIASEPTTVADPTTGTTP